MYLILFFTLSAALAIPTWGFSLIVFFFVKNWFDRKAMSAILGMAVTSMRQKITQELYHINKGAVHMLFDRFCLSETRQVRNLDGGVASVYWGVFQHPMIEDGRRFSLRVIYTPRSGTTNTIHIKAAPGVDDDVLSANIFAPLFGATLAAQPAFPVVSVSDERVERQKKINRLLIEAGIDPLTLAEGAKAHRSGAIPQALLVEPWAEKLCLWFSENANCVADLTPANIAAQTEIYSTTYADADTPSIHLPEEIDKIVRLEILSFTDHAVATLPETIGNLRNLKGLLFLRNRLASLPDEICALKNLTEINANWNRLTALPDNIGELGKLRDLALSGNRLTGLPRSITKLVNLQYFDISENSNLRLSQDQANWLISLMRKGAEVNLDLPLRIKMAAAFPDFSTLHDRRFEESGNEIATDSLMPSDRINEIILKLEELSNRGTKKSVTMWIQPTEAPWGCELHLSKEELDIANELNAELFSLMNFKVQMPVFPYKEKFV